MKSCLNCLRCKQAKLAAPNNIDVIRCSKQNNKVVDINLLGCQIADNLPGGDRSRRVTEVEAEYYKQQYLKQSTQYFSSVTQRDKSTITFIGRKLGMNRTNTPPLNSHLKKKNMYTPEQKAFLEEQLRKGNWPFPGGNDPKEDSIRNYIVENINGLGPAHTWNQIVKWRHYLKKFKNPENYQRRLEYQRQLRKRKAEHKKQQKATSDV